MVRRFLNILHREFSGLHETAFLLAVSSLLSQLLALFRDRLLASSFGAGSHLDIYYASFRLPDLIYVSIASFVSVTVLIPFLIERMKEEDLDEAKKFLSAIFNIFLLIIFSVSLLFFFLAPFLASLIAPGFGAEEKADLVLLTRILLLSPILLGLSNLFGSVTQAYKKFLVYSLSPILYNLGIILGIVFFYPSWGLAGLAWGVVLGAFFHLFIQITVIKETGFWPTFGLPVKKEDWREIYKVAKTSLPRTLALSFQQMASLILVAFASFMAKGSISIFNFSLNLQSVPLTIIGISYSVAAFPTLAKLFSVGHKEAFLKQISTAARHIVFWSLPATVLFVVLRAQIVRVILGAGLFDWEATRLTAASLALFVLSVSAQSLISLLTRAYYAAGRTFKPLISSLSSSAIMIILVFFFNQLFSASFLFRYFLEGIFRVSDLPGSEVLILPLSFSLASILNLIVLWWLFRKDFGRTNNDSVSRSFWQSFSASVIGGFATYNLLNLLSLVIVLDTFLNIFLQGLIAGLGGVGVMILILWLMNNRELGEFYSSLRKKIWRVEALAPEQSEL